ncbi:MAG TPA: hypothetical protein VMC85_23415 [Desulfomonilaceae bacterium]|nr:hypothetical protein [Desulfomonilaceae bacterium]
MKANRTCLISFVVIAILLSGASLAYAQKNQKKIKVDVAMKKGDEVTMFYGGTGDMKEIFPVGGVMNVYEKVLAFGLNENERIGRVKIVGYVGDNYLKAQVVEGTMRAGDVVKLKPGPGPAGMVMPPIQKK